MTRPVVAVDLGDTMVAAAADLADPERGGGAPFAPEPVDLPTDLAAVFAPADGDALVTGGDARRRAASDPARYEPTPRRRADDGELLLGTRTVGVAEAWGAVVSDAVARAGALLRGGRPRRLVLTHPVEWDAGRVELLRRAGSGLADDLLLLTEPVAAATYAAWMRPRRRGSSPGPRSAGGPGPPPGTAPVAVLDVGATAARAAVVVPGRGQVLAHRVDERFGGADADEMLLAHLLADPATGGEARDRVREVAAGATLGDRRHRQVLLDDVRAAKERLSDVEQCEIPMPGGGTAAWLARSEAEEVLAPAWREVVALLAEVVAAAGTTPDRLDAIWLTGGAARTPQLATLVHRELGIPATVAPDPGLVVARGALVTAFELHSGAASTSGPPSGPVPAPTSGPWSGPVPVPASGPGGGPGPQAPPRPRGPSSSGVAPAGREAPGAWVTPGGHEPSGTTSTLWAPPGGREPPGRGDPPGRDPYAPEQYRRSDPYAPEQYRRPDPSAYEQYRQPDPYARPGPSGPLDPPRRPDPDGGLDLDDQGELYAAGDPGAHPGAPVAHPGAPGAHPVARPGSGPDPDAEPYDPDADTGPLPPGVTAGGRGSGRRPADRPRPGEPDPFLLPPRRRFLGGPGRRRTLAVSLAALVLATVVAVGATILVAQRGDDSRADAGTPITAYGHRMVVPAGWVRSGGDDEARRTLLRPSDAPRGADLVAVQDNPSDGTDPEQVRAALRTQFDAARAAGSPITDLELTGSVGGRDVARYRQDPAPGVEVDWIVVLTPGSQVSVGCRHDTSDSSRVLAACEQVVASVAPLGP